MEAPMNNLYIVLLRLENRAAFFACKGFASDAEGNRRRAVVEASGEAHFVAERRHPHVTRYAERSGSVPGLSHLPLNCVPEARHFPINNALCHAENRRRAISYVNTGLARLPRDATHTHLPPKSGCRCRLMASLQIQ